MKKLLFLSILAASFVSCVSLNADTKSEFQSKVNLFVSNIPRSWEISSYKDPIERINTQLQLTSDFLREDLEKVKKNSIEEWIKYKARYNSKVKPLLDRTIAELKVLSL